MTMDKCDVCADQPGLQSLCTPRSGPPLPGVLCPVATAGEQAPGNWHFVERCDTCAIYDGDDEASYAMARHLGSPIRRFDVKALDRTQPAICAITLPMPGEELKEIAMTESEFTIRLGHEDECLDTTLANMRDHGLAHADTMWGEIGMVTDNDNQTVWIIRVDWPKLTKELES